MNYKKLELGSPIRANLEITHACPLACKHCYTFWGYSATGVKISSSNENLDYQHFVSIIDILSKLGIRIITITGGEPWMKKDILYPLIKYAKQLGMIVFINTSASLIEDNDARIIKTLNADGYLVSLMSCHKDVHNRLAQANVFDKTVAGIKILVSVAQNVCINMVCSKENYKDVKETAKFAESLGVSSFSAAPMMAALSFPEYLAMRLDNDELINVIKDLIWVQENTNLLTTTLESLPYCAFPIMDLPDYRCILSHSYCGAGMTDMAISPTGDVRPCIMSNESVGNLLVEKWESIWNRMSIWRTIQILPAECQECAVVDECGGGCRISAHTVNGTFSSCDPYMAGKIPFIPWDCSLMKKKETTHSHIKELNKPYSYGKKTALKISNLAIDRIEPFGGTIFIGNRALFLKQEPYDLYLKLKEMESFTVNQATVKYQLNNEDFVSFIQILTDEGIVNIV